MAIGLIQVMAQLRPYLDSLYSVKWATAVALIGLFLFLGRGRFATHLAAPFAMAVAIVAIGLLSQLGDGIDTRAVTLAVTFLLTAFNSMVIAPPALARRWVRCAVWSGLMGGVLLGVVFGFVGGILALPEGLLFRDQQLRYYGLFGHPNSAGTVALTGVMLVGAVSAVRKHHAFLLLGIPLFGAIVLADARGAELAALVFIAIWGVLWLWQSRPGLRPVVLGMLLIVATGLAAKLIIATATSSRVDVDQLASGRLDSWKRSLAYLDTPAEWLFGVGLSRNHSFVSYVSDAITDSRVTLVGIRGAPTDSTYIDLLTRTGIVGLGLFVALTCMLVRRAWRAWHSIISMTEEAAVAVAAVGAGAVHALFDSTTYSFGLTLAFVIWPLAGAVLMRAELHDRHGVAPNPGAVA